MISLRMNESVFAALEAALPLGHPDGFESVVLGLGRVARAGGRVTCVVDEVSPIEDYALREAYRVRVDDRVLLGLCSRLRGSGTIGLLAHTHPGGPGTYSAADDHHEREVARVVASASGGAVLLSMLHHPGGWSGRLWECGAAKPIDVGWITGRPLTQLIQVASAPATSMWARQTLALGPGSLLKLRGLRAGVVGLGGLGSPLADGLVRLGVQSLVLVDPDQVEPSNLSRLVNATCEDVGKSKVEVARLRLTATLPDVDVLALATSVEEPEARSALATCDVVFLVTDNHTSRYVGWEIARTAESLALLVGTDPHVGPSAAVERVSVYLADLLPTDGCPVCAGVLDPGHLRREALPVESLENERRDGYIPGVANPAVLPWNLTAVGEALGRLLELLAGLPPAPDRGQVRHLELLGAADSRMRVRRVPGPTGSCPCGKSSPRNLRPLL